MSAPICRSCRARIIWMRTESGKAMPCDPEVLTEYLVPMEDATPAQRQETRLTLVTTDGRVVTGIMGTCLTPFVREWKGRVPHWATCPQAKDFRR